MAHERGFTLIELMIVIAIIGIISSIVIPSYSGFIAVTKVSEAPIIARLYRERVQEFYAHRGYFPKNNKELGVPPEDAIKGSNISRVAIENGYIIAYFNDSSLNDGKPFVTYPCTNTLHPASPLLWNCEQVGGSTDYQRSNRNYEE